MRFNRQRILDRFKDYSTTCLNPQAAALLVLAEGIADLEDAVAQSDLELAVSEEDASVVEQLISEITGERVTEVLSADEFLAQGGMIDLGPK